MVLDLTQNQPNEKSPFSFEKTQQIGILSRNSKGWTTELNLVSYNGKTPTYDLRGWSPDGKMGKGLTLTDQTLENLYIVLKAHLEGINPEGQDEEQPEEEIAAHLPSDLQ